MAFDPHGDGEEGFSDGLVDYSLMIHASSGRSGKRNVSGSSLSQAAGLGGLGMSSGPLGGPVVYGAFALSLKDVLDSVSRGEFQDAAKQLSDLEGKGQRVESPVLDAFNRLFLQTEKAYLSMAYVPKHSPSELAAKYDTFAERLKIIKDSISSSSSEVTKEVWKREPREEGND